jgi:hypothetical protein
MSFSNDQVFDNIQVTHSIQIPTYGIPPTPASSIDGSIALINNPPGLGFFNGTVWTIVNLGSQGAAGSQGAQGSSGGPQGSQGSQGSAGGPQGFQGSQGNQGLVGPGGGAQGFQGVQGSQGSTGVGIIGLQGAQGVRGFQGTQGVQGQTGVGIAGAQGAQGQIGPGGGAQGSQGLQGFQGSQGLQGFQGFQGSQGSQGSQGNQGNQGLGNQGVQGPQGTSGAAGGVASLAVPLGAPATGAITLSPGNAIAIVESGQNFTFANTGVTVLSINNGAIDKTLAVDLSALAGITLANAANGFSIANSGVLSVAANGGTANTGAINIIGSGDITVSNPSAGTIMIDMLTSLAVGRTISVAINGGANVLVPCKFRVTGPVACLYLANFSVTAGNGSPGQLAYMFAPMFSVSFAVANNFPDQEVECTTWWTPGNAGLSGGNATTPVDVALFPFSGPLSGQGMGFFNMIGGSISNGGQFVATDVSGNGLTFSIGPTSFTYLISSIS